MINYARRDARRAAVYTAAEAAEAVRERDRARKAALSMWSRIEETDASDDLKEILHKLAEACGLEPD